MLTLQHYVLCSCQSAVQSEGPYIEHIGELLQLLKRVFRAAQLRSLKQPGNGQEGLRCSEGGAGVKKLPLAALLNGRHALQCKDISCF